MNISIEGLSKAIVKQIISDLSGMESSGQLEFHITKSQRWQIVNDWKDMIERRLTDAIVKDRPFTAGFDGSAKPNPGLMTIGGWIKDPDGNIAFKFTEIHGHGTNNEAEYRALIKIFEEVKKRGIKKIHIKGDSALAINQVNGTWKTKDPRMEQFKNQVLETAKGVDFLIEHVVRKYNAEADSLTR